MKFTKLTLRVDVLARLVLPDIPYEVPSAYFERVEMRLTAITARYEAILDGREPHDVLPAPTGKVIKGPWTRSDA